MALEQEYQREPTEEEIAENMDITPREVKENMKIAHKTDFYGCAFDNG